MSWVLSTLATLFSGAATERQLVERIAVGDRSALRELYGRLGGRALAVCLRVLRDREDAEDILQETFVEVWKRAREFDPARGTVKSWLLTIARSRAINRYNSRKSSQRAVGAAADEPPPPHAPSPLQLVEGAEDAARVQAALAELPSEQRHVIELSFYNGLSHSEIAAETQLSLGTVKTRIRLAMDKLARSLGAAQELAS